jgi:ATP-dependent DNA helicase RecG
MNFLERNLRHVQENPALGFNQPGTLEISREALQEVLVNALVHRDYLINASIKLFVFSDRVEIMSPGILPNSLTIDAVRLGVSVPRNSVLLSHAQYVMPWRRTPWRFQSDGTDEAAMNDLPAKASMSPIPAMSSRPPMNWREASFMERSTH